ncbi:MAG: hypothetical protein JJ866_12030 [Roseibium sp.]|uniref:hypothetical protein n=1 Tax=Roseibium sp. TaxID=1936156 RepID=UPI001B069832|nr:hypothetical protein [Roseibium sp.]MBO6892662.1 hypothetical protein [Roseibium sp.]
MFFFLLTDRKQKPLIHRQEQSFGLRVHFVGKRNRKSQPTDGGIQQEQGALDMKRSFIRAQGFFQQPIKRGGGPACMGGSVPELREKLL